MQKFDGARTYDVVFKFCAGLTNFHYLKCPLRAQDGEKYELYKSRLYYIGDDIVQKRKRAQERYRNKQRRRSANRFSDSQTQDEDYFKK